MLDCRPLILPELSHVPPYFAFLSLPDMAGHAGHDELRNLSILYRASRCRRKGAVFREHVNNISQRYVKESLGRCCEPL
jgi:hypothetical protein